MYVQPRADTDKDFLNTPIKYMSDIINVDENEKMHLMVIPCWAKRKLYTTELRKYCTLTPVYRDFCTVQSNFRMVLTVKLKQ